MAEILSIGELLDLGSASTAGLIPYSALEYSAQVITGISGSAIGGQGEYLPKSASGDFIPSTASSQFVTGGPYLPESASSQFITSTAGLQPSGDYAYNSAISGKVDQSAFEGCCSSMSSTVSSLETSVTSISATVSGLTGTYLEQSASSMFQPSGNYQTAGDYAYNSSLSSYLPESASGAFAPSGNYAYNSSMSSKLDASASSQFQPSGNYQTAGDYAYNSSLSAYQDRSSISAWTGDMSSISAKLDQSAFTSYTSTVNIHEYTGVSPIVVDNDADLISLSATAVHLDSSLRTYNSGTSAMVGLTYPTVIVGNSSQATGNNVIYIVTGSN